MQRAEQSGQDAGYQNAFGPQSAGERDEVGGYGAMRGHFRGSWIVDADTREWS